MSSKNPRSSEIKILTRNRKAHQKYSILESFEAGIALHGHEVKSLRQSRVSIEEGLVKIDRGEIFLFNVHIPPYSHLSNVEYHPTRTRKLLMHRSEIDRLEGMVQAKGMTLIPLEFYFKRGMAKVSVGLVKGKKIGDRREEIKKRESEREIRRGFRTAIIR